MTSPPPLLDVRSPGEYTKGHWPGALSLPLFDNAERAEVGTLYKRDSPDAAFLQGLELVGKKMRWYVEEARRLAPNQEVAIHCWRGGQRSQSMGWLLGKTFSDVQVIEGGYKALRKAGREALKQFSRPVLVLSGPTGSGKTKILQALKELGETVVDLEGIASHKGSAFGALGEDQQPTVEHFENLLFHHFLQLNPLDTKPVWLEDESQSIGRVYLPAELWQHIASAPLVVLDLPLEWRIDNLVEDYANYPVEELKEAFGRIRKRLGGQHLQAALAALDQQDYAAAASIALRYYDKAYALSQQKHQRQVALRLRPDTNDPHKIAVQLWEWCQTYHALV
ncbi:MAG: tRNA 2-selenouridine(34) synthase MnmH [Bacteroidota bacterium]